MTTRKSAEPHEPSQNLTDALEGLAKAEELLEEKRQAARKAVADELRASGLSHAKIAALTPWTEETVRNIAKEHGVTPKRKPTVRSIKD
ncbi:hypothetical protein [Streptomyces sp. PA03-2a]|jgi:hypothetical protein|uniref:hypothetical protein n=1 Tax=Streptomyces sp. PA03-2a TaxID=3028701 RepID=UPI0029B8C33E|nr:hypothetical protein [Streptomyces sp. PA03-2a]MDX2732889.1 hypothetical protein [Streptomyces sp. PA03-2a]